MGLSQQESLSKYGTVAYTGWNEPEAGYDAKAKGLTGGVGGGGTPSFNFDFAAEAQKAYGELGAYYDRILKESKGDLNLALSRLVEDYDRGKRIRTEDLASNQKTLDYNKQNAEMGLKDQALARGIYNKSLYGADQGRGIYDEEYQNKINRPFDFQNENLLSAFNRSNESADILKGRAQYDLPEAQRRQEFDMEQQRRKEAADIANQKGSMAFNQFSSSLF